VVVDVLELAVVELDPAVSPNTSTLNTSLPSVSSITAFSEPPSGKK